jgi:hypothetical protein
MKKELNINPLAQLLSIGVKPGVKFCKIHSLVLLLCEKARGPKPPRSAEGINPEATQS